MLAEVLNRMHLVGHLVGSPWRVHMARLGEADHGAGFFMAESDVEADVEGSFQEAEKLSSTLTAQPIIDKGHDVVSGVIEPPDPRPQFIVAVCPSNLVVIRHFVGWYWASQRAQSLDRDDVEELELEPVGWMLEMVSARDQGGKEKWVQPGCSST